MERVDDRAQAELESQIYKRRDHLLTTFERLRGQFDRRRTKITGRAQRVQRNTMQLLIGAGIGLGLAFVRGVIHNVNHRRRIRAERRAERHFEPIPAGYGHRLPTGRHYEDAENHDWASMPGTQGQR